jgi:hypothetical protein
MKRAVMVLTVPLALTACAGSGPAGARLAPPDASLTAPCARPERHLGVNDFEIMAGRIGDDLILCGAKQAALAKWSTGVVEAMGGNNAVR